MIAQGTALQLSDGAINIQPQAPELLQRQRRKPAHRLAIGAATAAGQAFLALSGQPELASGKHQAGEEAAQIPLERTAQGLVEVVEIEEQCPFRRGVVAEVEQMGIAAELNLHTAAGQRRQVGGHHRRRPAEAGEGIRGHAGVTHRHEPSEAIGILRLQQRDRIGAFLG